jgi:hypothetical protein
VSEEVNNDGSSAATTGHFSIVHNITEQFQRLWQLEDCKTEAVLSGEDENVSNPTRKTAQKLSLDSM